MTLAFRYNELNSNMNNQNHITAGRQQQLDNLRTELTVVLSRQQLLSSTMTKNSSHQQRLASALGEAPFQLVQAQLPLSSATMPSPTSSVYLQHNAPFLAAAPENILRRYSSFVTTNNHQIQYEHQLSSLSAQLAQEFQQQQRLQASLRSDTSDGLYNDLSSALLNVVYQNKSVSTIQSQLSAVCGLTGMQQQRQQKLSPRDSYADEVKTRDARNGGATSTTGGIVSDYAPASAPKYQKSERECYRKLAPTVTNASHGIIVTCKARGVSKDHNKKTAYFVISEDIKHGADLSCSHVECQKKGVRFVYCIVCDEPVAKINFRTRHSHPEILMRQDVVKSNNSTSTVTSAAAAAIVTAADQGQGEEAEIHHPSSCSFTSESLRTDDTNSVTAPRIPSSLSSETIQPCIEDASSTKQRSRNCTGHDESVPSYSTSSSSSSSLRNQKSVPGPEQQQKKGKKQRQQKPPQEQHRQHTHETNGRSIKNMRQQLVDNSESPPPHCIEVSNISTYLRSQLTSPSSSVAQSEKEIQWDGRKEDKRKASTILPTSDIRNGNGGRGSSHQGYDPSIDGNRRNSESRKDSNNNSGGSSSTPFYNTSNDNFTSNLSASKLSSSSRSCDIVIPEEVEKKWLDLLRTRPNKKKRKRMTDWLDQVLSFSESMLPELTTNGCVVKRTTTDGCDCAGNDGVFSPIEEITSPSQSVEP